MTPTQLDPTAPTMGEPRFPDDPAYQCLRTDDPDGFHRQASERKVIDLSDCDLRGLDLRHVDLRKVIIRGAYLRNADLRGQDLRLHDLEGCSLLDAHIGGTYFPANVSAEEIRLSRQFGTRVRTFT